MKTFPVLHHLIFTAVITIIMAVIYVTVQQSYRTAANDPQIQMSADIAENIRGGRSSEDIFRVNAIDISRSLSTFVVLYDSSGSPVKCTGFLNGKMPQLPAGVFEVARQHGQHEVTWQPRMDVRMAMVVACTGSSPVQFVAVGRSLKEVENREYTLRKTIIVAWLICIGLVVLSAALQFYRKA